MVAFGPCLHIATLAVDLANSAPLREALLDGRPTEVEAEGARARRLLLAAEIKYRTALRTWTATAGGEPIEIAASPWEEGSTHGRAYGDRSDPGATRSLSIFVRKRGEKKLLLPREAMTFGEYALADRRVLEYAHDRGTGRKAIYASGVHASLALEAMRTHGGVFAAGLKMFSNFAHRSCAPAWHSNSATWF